MAAPLDKMPRFISLYFMASVICLLLSSCTISNVHDDLWSWGAYTELSSGPVELTVVPLDEGTFFEITPMGHMHLPQHPIPTSAGGFSFSSNGYGKPVKAPADGIITAIRFTYVYGPDGTPFPDYAVRIYHSNTFITWFDHLSAIDNYIIARTGALNPGWNKARVRIQAGQTFGRTATSPDHVVGLGMYAYDKEKTLAFINPEKYGPFGAHAVFAFDYFREDIKNHLFSYIRRIAAPRGGKIDYDIQGTVSGNWILQGSDVISSTEPWNYWLAFVYDMYYPECRRISIGAELGKMIDKPNGVLAQPVEGPPYSEVTRLSGPMVYRLADAVEGVNAMPAVTDISYTLLVELMEDHKAKIEIFKGNIEAPAFTANAKIYTR